MVLGFLGTLICLERAVALRMRPGYLAPAAAGAGGVALAVGLPLPVGQLALLVGGVALVGLYAAAGRRQPGLHLGVMAAGALSWVLAVTGWLAGRDVALLVPALAGFLVLTIVGERLELARFGGLSRRARRLFLGAAGLFGLGVVVSLAAPVTGVRISGAGLLALAGWLAVHDIARRTVRSPGLPRFIAVSLLAGYAWLAVGGALWLGIGTLRDGPAYDAMLHAIFLGFVMSMIFAHAPVIVPAVFGVAVPYRARFYLHVVTLHASLLLRVVGGDLAGSRPLWQLGGVLNEVAILGFLAVTAQVARTARRSHPVRPLPSTGG